MVISISLSTSNFPTYCWETILQGSPEFLQVYKERQDRLWTLDILQGCLDGSLGRQTGSSFEAKKVCLLSIINLGFLSCNGIQVSSGLLLGHSVGIGPRWIRTRKCWHCDCWEWSSPLSDSWWARSLFCGDVSTRPHQSGSQIVIVLFLAQCHKAERKCLDEIQMVSKVRRDQALILSYGMTQGTETCMPIWQQVRCLPKDKDGLQNSPQTMKNNQQRLKCQVTMHLDIGD